MIAKYSLVSFQYTLNEAYLSVNMKTNEVILKEAKEKYEILTLSLETIYH